MTDIHRHRYELVKLMLTKAGLWNDKIGEYLDKSTFVDVDDGGMGSFAISGINSDRGSRDYSEAIYIDSDGLQVIIALIGDENGYPTDVDFWKVDSSPLLKFPASSDLAVTKK